MDAAVNYSYGEQKVKIKRFTGTDMRQVLRRVREDQGPDAVILSNQRIDGGIEVIAAVDYDEALMQHALGSQPIAAVECDKPGAVTAAGTSKARVKTTHAAGDIEHSAASSPEPSTCNTARMSSSIAGITDSPDVDPALQALRSEISSLRGLLETQLSGLLWRDGSRRYPLRAQILRNLARIGIASDIAMCVADRLEPIQDVKHIWRSPLAELSQMIPVADSKLLDTGGIAALIGPTGVGKTTTIAKLAARYAMRHSNDDVALVCADAYRIGAREHLTAFANIIGVKVHSVSHPEELTTTLDRLKSKKLILIDTEGVSQRDAGLASRLAGFNRNGLAVDFYLTLSAASQESGLDETIRRFSDVPLAGAVITKIDEAGQLGCVIGSMIRRELPATWFCDGQRIPDDLHAATRKKLWFVNQAVECMETSEPAIDERYMAENYSQASVVNA